MHNLRTVFGFEFSRTIRRKSFWVTTLAIPVLIGAVIALSYFSDKSAGKEATQASQQKFSFMVLDESKLVSPVVLKAVKAEKAVSKPAGIAAVANGQVDAFFYYPPNPVKNPVEVYAKDVGITKNDKYTAVAQQLLQSSVQATVGSPEKLALISTPPNTELTTYANGKTVDDGLNRALPPAVFIILFYLVIILLGNQMLSSTTEEKENRVIEMILTTVSSTSLIIGKILSMMAVGLLQIIVTLIPPVVGYIYFRSSLNVPDIDLTKLVFDPAQMAVGALAFAGGFLVFTGLLVAIGAAMPTAKEANRFFGVAVIAMVLPVYAIAAIITDPNTLIVRIFTYFPVTAPVTIMIRNASGNLTTHEAVIGVAIALVSGVLAIAIAIRSFKYGTLQYSRKLTLKELLGSKA
jgi:ABC-2 type transport system permease protein